ncbi:acyl carrier protein [Granulicatella balaenopterae]|uniref:Acyl carrier protein n=1 Tax=Granulicatella balaenopterae TaxID=137733 RepID=A0A1H9P6Y8_9LACT|nr:acyl carrier protein [Granulicatella balaenopterae]SER44084.1 acyl carrier protein [Granulicatella balaenopterae]
MSDTFNKVAEIIAERFGLEQEKVTREMTFQQDLGADSIDIVELVMELEDTFDAQISDDDAEKIATVGDAVDYIENHLV